MSTRFGVRPVLLTGLVAIVAGLALFARAPVTARYVVDLLPAMLLLGVAADDPRAVRGRVRRG